MPNINVMFWNIENFGNTGVYKQNYTALLQFIARIVQLRGVDILCLQELKAPAIALRHLNMLQAELCALPAPLNNWHFEWITGSIAANGQAPYATANDLDWDAAHHEGYAAFWNQDISKFRVLQAPPIAVQGGGPAAANTQSETTRTFGFNANPNGPPIPLWGSAFLPGGLVVPPDPAYTLPVGTTEPGVPAQVAPQAVNSGYRLPAGTLIGQAGVTLNAPFLGRDPVVIPGGQQIVNSIALPAPGTVLIPEHAQSLVLHGRDTSNNDHFPSRLLANISGLTSSFIPQGANNWIELFFTRGAGFPASRTGCRRPSYMTIEVTVPPAAPNAPPVRFLTPILSYHAPASPTAAGPGLQRAAFSQPIYQAYDPAAGAWVDNNFTILGGDMNVATDLPAYAWQSLQGTFANPAGGIRGGGGNCAPGIYNPAPIPPPGRPPARANNVLNKSTVRLNAGIFGPRLPIFNAVADAYRNLAIDNVFFRGFAAGNARATLEDLFAFVTLANPWVPNQQRRAVSPFAFLPLFDAHLRLLFNQPAPPVPPTPDINNMQTFVLDLSMDGFRSPDRGNDTRARRAAEFLRLCVSDHLPVLLTGVF
jgi:hypothetical protein